MNAQTIVITRHEGADGTLASVLITLNRPKQLNALNDQLMDELGQAMTEAEAGSAHAASRLRPLASHAA